MWRWDQGHVSYLQFDALRQIASYVVDHDFKAAQKSELFRETGLRFAAPKTHKPWRQYARALKVALLVTESDDKKSANPTAVARLLATPGSTTCDEYFHFLARTFTEPSPAFDNWSPDAPCRYPLLFCLRYVLTKVAITGDPITHIGELFGAYKATGMIGDEDDTAYIKAVGSHRDQIGAFAGDALRQARESLYALCQISYLHLDNNSIVVSLDKADAHSIFEDLNAVTGPRAESRDLEIQRLSELFRDGANEDFYEYPHTAISDAAQSGFVEGTKVKRTHLVIERNQELRRAFFDAHPQALCDVCRLDTASSYPWTRRVLDIHHLLPLASGTRVLQIGRKTATTFDDLVPVCPTCHRAVHRFYDGWLREHSLQDFVTDKQARETYLSLKSAYGGPIYG